MRIVPWVTFAFGVALALVTVFVLQGERRGAPALGVTTAFAQECVSEALPVQVPGARDSAAVARMLLPSTGNAGVLPGSAAPSALQECPTPAAEASVAPAATATIATPAASATPATAPTPTAVSGGALPGGGGGGSPDLSLPPGAISY